MTLQDNPLTRMTATFSAEDLRRAFLVTGMFAPARQLRWWETDRTVMGAVIPVAEALPLTNPPSLKCAFFLERREPD